MNDTHHDNFQYSYDHLDNYMSLIPISNGHHSDFKIYLIRTINMRQKKIQRNLQANLMEYIWALSSMRK